MMAASLLRIIFSKIRSAWTMVFYLLVIFIEVIWIIIKL